VKRLRGGKIQVNSALLGERHRGLMKSLLRQALAEFCIRSSAYSKASAALRQGLPQQQHCVRACRNNGTASG
jgi:hypothetical protein